MKKINILIFLLFVTVNVFANSPSKIAKEVADSMQSSLPTKVDFLSTIERISSRGNILHYEYVLNLTKNEFSEMKDLMKPSVIEELCSSALLKKILLDNGVGIQYSYYDLHDKELLDSFIIDKSSCR
jgi:hypothetical protein